LYSRILNDRFWGFPAEGRLLVVKEIFLVFIEVVKYSPISTQGEQAAQLKFPGIDKLAGRS
jgi:hypothetical protein